MSTNTTIVTQSMLALVLDAPGLKEIIEILAQLPGIKLIDTQRDFISYAALNDTPITRWLIEIDGKGVQVIQQDGNDELIDISAQRRPGSEMEIDSAHGSIQDVVRKLAEIYTIGTMQNLKHYI